MSKTAKYAKYAKGKKKGLPILQELFKFGSFRAIAASGVGGTDGLA